MRAWTPACFKGDSRGAAPGEKRLQSRGSMWEMYGDMCGNGTCMGNAWDKMSGNGIYVGHVWDMFKIYFVI